jgi:hypothetical protein
MDSFAFYPGLKPGATTRSPLPGLSIGLGAQSHKRYVKERSEDFSTGRNFFSKKEFKIFSPACVTLTDATS